MCGGILCFCGNPAWVGHMIAGRCDSEAEFYASVGKPVWMYYMGLVTRISVALVLLLSGYVVGQWVGKEPPYSAVPAWMCPILEKA